MTFFFFFFNVDFVDLSPQGWDLTAGCRASRGRCPELHTSGPAQSSARCDPGKWPPTGAAAGGGPTAAPDSWLLGCPADKPPGGGGENSGGRGRVWDVFRSEEQQRLREFNRPRQAQCPLLSKIHHKVHPFLLFIDQLYFWLLILSKIKHNWAIFSF